MLLLGLVGGIASGKSLVADGFRQLGAAVLDADRAGHEVLRDPDVVAALRARWGQRVLDASGQINRSAVAKIVFAPGNAGEKAFLESVTHPRIETRLNEQLAEAKSAANPPPIAVLDAALLFEAGWDKLCGKVVFVECPRELRLSRAKARGWTEEQFTAREAAQMPVEAKRRRADFIIDNSGPPALALASVRELWSQLATSGAH
jgi:dephospho-CoA kinase